MSKSSAPMTGQDLLTVGAQDAGLGNMDMTVDKAGKNQASFQTRDGKPRIPGGDCFVIPKGFDDAVLKNKKPVRIESRRDAERKRQRQQETSEPEDREQVRS
jgi:hypothetical protein